MLFSIIDNIQRKHFGGKFFGVDSNLYLIKGKKKNVYVITRLLFFVSLEGFES